MTRQTMPIRIALRLPHRLSDALAQAAEAEERTLSSYVREVLRRELLVQHGGGADAVRSADTVAAPQDTTST